MIATAALLLFFGIGSILTIESDSRLMMYMIYILPQVGVYGLWFALIASIWSATQYTITFVGHLKKLKQKSSTYDKTAVYGGFIFLNFNDLKPSFFI